MFAPEVRTHVNRRFDASRLDRPKRKIIYRLTFQHMI